MSNRTHDLIVLTSLVALGTTGSFFLAGWLPIAIFDGVDFGWFGGTNIGVVLGFFVWPMLGGIIVLLEAKERLLKQVAFEKSDIVVLGIASSGIAGALSLVGFMIISYFLRIPQSISGFIVVPLFYTATIVIGSRFVKWKSSAADPEK
jgi:hypothetical protein